MSQFCGMSYRERPSLGELRSAPHQAPALFPRGTGKAVSGGPRGGNEPPVVSMDAAKFGMDAGS